MNDLIEIRFRSVWANSGHFRPRAVSDIVRKNGSRVANLLHKQHRKDKPIFKFNRGSQCSVECAAILDGHSPEATRAAQGSHWRIIELAVLVAPVRQTGTLAKIMN